MTDTEDWRRQRAEALKLHDASPWPVRPARDRQPAVADGIEPMRPPVEPVRPLVAPTNSPPVRDDNSRGDSGIPRGAEPVARSYRQEAPLAQSTAAVSIADAPLGPRRTAASRAPATSMIARHPLVFGAAIGGALTAAGALGWLLRVETEPVTVPATVVIRSAPPVAPPILPPAPVVQPAIMPAMRGPTAALADEAARPASVAPVAAPEDRTPPLAPELAPAIKAALPHGTTASAARRILPRVGTVPAYAAKPKPVSNSKALTDRKSNSDKASRFAHPAKSVALPGRGFSPSFNCRRAIAAVNRAICANPTLSALDRQLSQSFYRATAHVDLERNKAIDRDQVDFLNQRASCNSDECVARVYRERLAALRQAGPEN